ncbi:MAG TPA: hypothetical protein DCE14_08700 [Kosmotogaceae bacterium]|nr:hypothetical protein [Kosmotogaceae bacterium]
MLGSLDSGLIVMNLVLLGAVILVPFPTNLVGKAPHGGVAVVFFISLFLIVSLLYLFMTLRTHSVKVWRGRISSSYFFWMIGKWSSGIAVELFALILALRFPIAGLVILAVSMIFGPLASHLSRGVIRRYTE